MSDIIRVKFDLSTGYCGADHEDIVEYDIEGMTQEEIEGMLEEDWKEWMWGYVDGGWNIQEEDDA